MSTILSLLGSPSARSRSGALLGELESRLGAALSGRPGARRIALRELPPEPLLRGDASDPAIAAAVGAVAEAELILVATPIYKAAYSGLLKAFLDLLPQDALRGKTLVPLATGGTVAHLLALDYALKPVLGALGARDIRDAVFATDAQLPPEGAGYAPVAQLTQRLERSVADLLEPPSRRAWHADRSEATDAAATALSLVSVRSEPAPRATTGLLRDGFADPVGLGLRCRA